MLNDNGIVIILSFLRLFILKDYKQLVILFVAPKNIENLKTLKNPNLFTY
jgi:hypothetical protein